MASNLEELNMTSEEVEQFTVAFQDPYFRDLFMKYAEELRDPENQRLYENEIRMMELERGMGVKFVHPEPGHVLQTSIDGQQTCFVNVCSCAVVSKPYCKPGTDKEGRPGQHWSLPCSLTVPRGDQAPGVGMDLIYDVVFHPETMRLAGRSEKFLYLVNLTAMDTVAKQFNLRLDTKNFKTLSENYKGFPQVAIIREPLKSPLLHTLQDPTNTQPNNKKSRNPLHPVSPHQLEVTTPQYIIRHRSYVDLQDYQNSRDSAPSTVPKELVVTVDLPLSRDANDINIFNKGKTMVLEAKPVYKLSISLPYLVEDKLSTATFEKVKKQLVITMPVVQDLPKLRPVPCCRENVCPQPNATTENTCSLPHNHPECPIFTCSQDATSVTLIADVKDINTHSVTSEVSSYQCKIRFCVKTGAPYVLFVSFLPEYCLNTSYISTSVSADNMIIRLTKSPECFGPWKNLFFGVNSNSLQERFINEENMAGILQNGPPHSPSSTVEDPPLINLMDMSERRAQSRLNKPDLEEKLLLVNGEQSSGLSGVTKPGSSRSDDTDQSERSETAEERRQSPPAARECPAQLQHAGHSSEEDEGLCTPDRECDEDDLPDGAELVQNPTPNPSSTEQVLKDVTCSDHRTQCAFKFDNALLFDLD